MDLKSLRVGILGGGISEERQISLVSAQAALAALGRSGLNALFLDIAVSGRDQIQELIRQNRIELAFIALHGAFGEDGQIQQILEELHIPYTGSGPLASYRALDKIASKTIFLEKGIRTPAFKVWRQGDDHPQDIRYPAVVKPYLSGSSLGISLVAQPQRLAQALEEASRLQNKIVIEDYISGRELTVGILDNSPLAVVEIIPKEGFYNFHNKYAEGATDFSAPADLEELLYRQVQQLALAAHTALGCRHFSRVDLRLDRQNRPYVLEVNSIPGLTSHSLLPLSAKCCGIGFDQLILKMVMMASHKLEQRRGVSG